ncbi:hypothetical protein CNEONATNEC32_01126 [Clostridium neonatale]|nr:hypothetical protein CNEONATNEC32_01126 [Clostridium neonatale]
MASPDNIRNIQLFIPIFEISFCVPLKNTRPHAITRTTTVRIAVARSELIPSIPIFAKIDVSAAKSADSNAKTTHILCPPFNFFNNIKLKASSIIVLYLCTVYIFFCV